jgi:hypothetical protein
MASAFCSRPFMAKYNLMPARLIHRIRSFKAGLSHAFAVKPSSEPLSIEDVTLLEQVANAVVARGMATPATLFLESIGPMNFIGSQALHFFIPILEVVFPQRDMERVARLLERRDTLSRLVTLIECRAEPKPAGRS